VCRSESGKQDKIATVSTLAAIETQQKKYSALISLEMDGACTHALVDTGSTKCFIAKDLLKRINAKSFPCDLSVELASSSAVAVTKLCYLSFSVNGHFYENIKFLVLDNLCNDLILGLDFLSLHKDFRMHFGGYLDEFRIDGIRCLALNCMDIEPPCLFSKLDDSQAIAVPSRRYSEPNRNFISKEISQLLDDGIIEESRSPWRAQVVVVKNHGKQRLVIDYSKTVNKFSVLDAYPLSDIHDLAQ
jgi:hypothetical protein